MQELVRAFRCDNLDASKEAYTDTPPEDDEEAEQVGAGATYRVSQVANGCLTACAASGRWRPSPLHASPAASRRSGPLRLPRPARFAQAGAPGGSSGGGSGPEAAMDAQAAQVGGWNDRGVGRGGRSKPRRGKRGLHLWLAANGCRDAAAACSNARQAGAGAPAPCMQARRPAAEAALCAYPAPPGLRRPARPAAAAAAAATSANCMLGLAGCWSLWR